MLTVPVIFGLAASLSAWMTGRVRAYAVQRLLDRPNDRSSHTIPTPRGGGLAIVISFYAGLAALATGGNLTGMMFALLGTGVPVALVGWWDDHANVPISKRLLIQTLCATLAVVLVGGFPELPLGSRTLELSWLGVPAAFLWILWMLNLYNFMDGIDGIAGSQVVFVCAAATFLKFFEHSSSLDVPMSLGMLACATAGFLVWNWPPARIFMGDVGSGFLGFLIAVISLSDMRTPGGGLGLPVWTILNGLFLVDATYTLGRRITTRQTWYAAHRTHGYQKAALLLGRHGIVIRYCLSINVFWLFPLAYAARLFPSAAIEIAVAALVPVLGLVMSLRAGEQEAPESGFR